MAIYINQRTGQTCEAVFESGLFDMTLRLLGRPGEHEVGQIRWVLRDGELHIKALCVEGRFDNRPTEQHPCPGAGSLLMLLACLHARQRGARRVGASPRREAVDFYHRMGLHHPASLTRPAALDPAARSSGGRIDPVWRESLCQMLQHGRRAGWLESDVDTVVRILQSHVDAYWTPLHERRAWWRCVIA